MLALSHRRAALLAPLLAALALPAPALANGRYPASGQIAVAPGDPKTLLVRATYGLLLSQDSGKTWGWIREPAVGYSGVEDPVMSFIQNGTLLAGIFEGLAEGTPDGCQWGFFPALTNKYVIDLSVTRSTRRAPSSSSPTASGRRRRLHHLPHAALADQRQRLDLDPGRRSLTRSSSASPSTPRRRTRCASTSAATPARPASPA